MYRENNRFGRRGGDGMDTAPVKVGDELTVTIEAVGEKGDGVAKKDGFVLFVPGVKEGEQVRIRVTKVLRKVGFAEKIGEGEASAESDSQESEPASEPEEQELPQEDSEDFGEEQPQESEEFGEEPAEAEQELHADEQPAEEPETPAEEPAEEPAEGSEPDEERTEQ